MNIYEKMLAIMSEVQKLQKDDYVSYKNTNYKALSEEKVTTIMRNELIKYSLIVYPFEQTWNRQGNISHVDVKYMLVNAENPEEKLVLASCGDGADTQDKGSGKAMTYAFKYMWLRTFALPTGEDPDKISSEELDAQDKAREQKEKGYVITIKEMCKETKTDINKLLANYEANSIEDLTPDQADNAISILMKKRAKK